jgi:hypothetical protein
VKLIGDAAKPYQRRGEAKSALRNFEAPVIVAGAEIVPMAFCFGDIDEHLQPFMVQLH